MSNYYDSGQSIPNLPSGAPGPYQQYESVDPRNIPSQEAGVNFPVMLVTDDLISTASGVSSISEVVSEVLSLSSTSTQAPSEVGIDSLTNVGVNVMSITDLVAVIDAVTSTAVSAQSMVEKALDAITSTGSSVGAFTEAVAEALAQVSASAASLLEVAQEGVQSLAGSTGTAGETGVEALTLLTSMANLASLVEIDSDVLSSTASSSGSLSEKVAEAVANVVAAVESVAEVVADSLVNTQASLGSMEDSGFAPTLVTDSMANTMLLLNVLDDLVIATAQPVSPPWLWSYIARYGKGHPNVDGRKLERQAERIIVKDELPGHYTEGAKKAYAAFQGFYGDDEGKRIFMQKALEQGRGETVFEKVNDVYKTGAKVDQRKKLDVHVEVVADHVNVDILSASGGVTILRKGGQ